MSAPAIGSVAVSLAAAIPLLGAVNGGCDAPLHGGGGPGDASASCPATLSRASSDTCADEGLRCPIVLDCAPSFELVQCTCRGSRWACSDPVGPLDAGDEARCIAPPPPSKEPCPSTLPAGQGTACDDLGRQCFYEGEVCDSGITKLDYCSCSRDDAGALKFACLRVPCSPPIEIDR